MKKDFLYVAVKGHPFSRENNKEKRYKGNTSSPWINIVNDQSYSEIQWQHFRREPPQYFCNVFESV